MVQIVPSILAADFANLAAEIEKVERGGATMLHVDIMDGHFVPNLTMGPPVVKAIRRVTRLQLDLHLMITDPDRYAPIFIEAGADQISVQVETCPHLDRTLNMIRSEGAKAGVVLNPATPVVMIEEVLEVADFVLVMSVNPGFGGQPFIPRALDKIRRIRQKRDELGISLPIEIDGGITTENAAAAVRAGCDWLVTGTSVFHTPDPTAAVANLFSIAREAMSVQV
ncbi:MAG TPA: ribulose-phosphate 3-epimerase [Bryobacteraceae bacterium]|jgi:ribulose-phosphate 3-epimerase|nr:ribulose-phosphate 3-epimerase [Bryobacteraceae bacterium]